MGSCFEPFHIFATKTFLSKDLFILPYLQCTTTVRVPHLELKSLKTDQLTNVNVNTQEWKCVTDTNEVAWKRKFYIFFGNLHLKQ